MRVHILMAGQSMTAKATGGPEGRESFGGRALARATTNQWRMLAPQIKPIPRTSEVPGRWHLVAGNTLKEFQAPFCDIKNQVNRLIEWATGWSRVPDVPAMMLGDAPVFQWGGGGGENAYIPSSEPPSPFGYGKLVSLRDWVQEKDDLELATVLRWRERRADFPKPAETGERGTHLYDTEDLDAFLLARLS
jgi:hypothetical protein